MHTLACVHGVCVHVHVYMCVCVHECMYVCVCYYFLWSTESLILNISKGKILLILCSFVECSMDSCM